MLLADLRLAQAPSTCTASMLEGSMHEPVVDTVVAVVSRAKDAV